MRPMQAAAPLGKWCAVPPRHVVFYLLDSARLEKANVGSVIELERDAGEDLAEVWQAVAANLHPFGTCRASFGGPSFKNRSNRGYVDAMFSVSSIFANPVVAFFVDYIAINHRPLAVIFVVLPLSFALRCVFAVFEWQQVLPSVVSCCRRFVAASVNAAEGTLADDQGQPVRQARG